MTFSLSSLSSDLKVPIVFMTWCYHTPFSMKERAHYLLSYSISSVKDVIVFPSFHIFALVDGQKRTRILYVWTRFQNRRESLVRCGRGLNINYVLICMVNFMYFNNRLPTYPKIYMFNFVIANGLRSRPVTIVFFSYCVHFCNLLHPL